MGCSGSKPAEDAVAAQPQSRAAPPQPEPELEPEPEPELEPEPEPEPQKPEAPPEKKKKKDKKGGRGGGGGGGARNVVAAKKLDIADNYKPPVHPKTLDESNFIKDALKKNFVFESLGDSEMEPLVKAFEKTTAPDGELIIKQGDDGDYFYIVKRGQVAFIVNDNVVGQAGEGASFGELALLYTCPRAASVKAIEGKVTMFRVDQTTFRFILQDQTQSGAKKRKELLTGVPFFADLQEADIQKLTAVMRPKPFSKGDYLMRKGDEADYLYIIDEGTVVATDIVVGDTKYEDVVIKPGSCVGERALVTGEPRAASVVAKTEGLAFGIDKDTFGTVMGDINELIIRSQDQNRLAGIKVIKNSNLDTSSFAALASYVKEKEFKAGTKILSEGTVEEAAIYFVRSDKDNPPKVKISSWSRSDFVEGDGHFGEELLMADRDNGKNGPDDPASMKCPYTVTVVQDCKCGVLTLLDCRKVFDTLFIGMIREDEKVPDVDMRELRRHALLGAGTFGQVWLVSNENPDGSRNAYALKIQSKFEIIQEGVAKGVCMEKNIMKELRHPFIIQLISTAKDRRFLYMVVGLVQGGELYNVIQNGDEGGIPEDDAAFYTAGISEGLAYMHRRLFAYRDLKPENVLIDKDGYPVIVDLGFCKKVKGMTYTLCGTPLYLAPEVIINKGHNVSCDHWSLGVLVYEMLTGETPFFKDGMNQTAIFKTIVNARFDMPGGISRKCESIIKGFLTKDPTKRLGSLAGGERDIVEHPWLRRFDFNRLRRKGHDPPFIPKIKDALDSSNFDDWTELEDKTQKKFPKLTPEEQKEFDTF